MKRLLLLSALAVVLVVPAQALAANITVSATGFTPASLTINQGDTVTWTNPDTATHQVMSRKAGFSSPVLSTGQTFSFVFKTAGSFSIQETLDKKLKGTVVVQATPKTAPSASIALFASKTAVLYGSAVTLSGTVSSKQSGEQVTVLAEAYGKSSFSPIATLTTGAGGAWSYAGKPTIRTVYEARTQHANSATVAVGVRPLVSFHVITGQRFSTKVIAGRSFTGRYVQLQRRSSSGAWVTLKRLPLNTSSAAIFRAALPHGASTLRIAISVNQAGAGYLGGTSRTILYHRA